MEKPKSIHEKRAIVKLNIIDSERKDVEKRNNWIKTILLIAGIIEIVAGLAHFTMPYFAYEARGFSFLNQDETNLITLCVFAVGILLIAFGTLTIFFALKAETAKQLLYFYVIIKSLLWLGRIILEIFYPVKISLFFIESPSKAIMPLLIFECLLFVFPAALITLNNFRKQP